MNPTDYTTTNRGGAGTTTRPGALWPANPAPERRAEGRRGGDLPGWRSALSWSVQGQRSVQTRQRRTLKGGGS